MATPVPMSGRRAQAARNDKVIFEAARDVFIAEPTAPISTVAKRAGVGISALYRRYGNKEGLLRELCWDGLRTYNRLVKQALADERDPWTAFAAFMQAAVEAETSSLTLALAGTFQQGEEILRDAARADRLTDQLMARITKAGVVRDDLEVKDIEVIFELLAVIEIGDKQRTIELRRRYLTLILDGLQNPPTTSTLPAPAPTWEELENRWG